MVRLLKFIIKGLMMDHHFIVMIYCCIYRVIIDKLHLVLMLIYISYDPQSKSKKMMVKIKKIFKYCPYMFVTGEVTTGQRPNCTRQRTHGKKLIGKALFYRVSFIGHSAKKSDRHGAGPVDGGFAECQPCRHSAKIFLFFLKKILCRVPSIRPSAKMFYFFF